MTDGKATSSLNGAIADEAFSGTYTVNPDCTGTFAAKVFDLSGNLLFTATLNLAWDDNMRELRLIFTSAVRADGTRLTIVISGDAKYLHSSLVQTRAIDRTPAGLRTAMRFSVSNWSTTDENVEPSINAILRAAQNHAR